MMRIRICLTPLDRSEPPGANALKGLQMNAIPPPFKGLHRKPDANSRAATPPPFKTTRVQDEVVAVPIPILLLLPDGTMANYCVCERPLAMGSSADCDIYVPDDGTSACSARLSLRNGRVYIQNEGALSDARVNGNNLPASTPVLLESGDKVQLGCWHAEIRFLQPAGWPSDQDPSADHSFEWDRRGGRRKWLLTCVIGAAALASGLTGWNYYRRSLVPDSSPLEQAEEHVRQGENARALEVLGGVIEENYPADFRLLAEMHANSVRLDPDPERVAALLSRIAKDGGVETLVKVGDLAIRIGDEKRALDVLSRAADQGCGEAFYLLGLLYIQKYHGDESLSEAGFNFLLKAANRGYKRAEWEIVHYAVRGHWRSIDAGEEYYFDGCVLTIVENGRQVKISYKITGGNLHEHSIKVALSDCVGVPAEVKIVWSEQSDQGLLTVYDSVLGHHAEGRVFVEVDNLQKP